MNYLADARFAARFWSKVRKTDGCWLWVGACNNMGYAHLGSGPRPAKTLLASRVMYESVHGDMAVGLHVCHTCDNPKCVNPDHLFLGTRSDNMRDCVRKGRQVSPFRSITHCKRGHEFTPENTKHITAPAGGPGRSCRACGRLRSQKGQRLSMTP